MSSRLSINDPIFGGIPIDREFSIPTFERYSLDDENGPFWSSEKKSKRDEAIQGVSIAISLGRETIGLGNKLYKLGSHIKDAGRATTRTVSRTARVAGGAFKAIGLLAVPFAFKDLHDGIKKMFTGNTNDKVDGAFKVADSAETFVNATIVAGGLLADFGAVTSEAISWVDPLGYVAAALSGVTLLVNGKGLWDSHKFKKHINGLLNNHKGQEITQNEFNTLIDFIQNEKEKKLAKQLKVSPKKFKMRMEQLRQIANEQFQEGENETAQEIMAETVKLVRKRIVRKQMKHAVSMVAAAVSTAGLAVLMFSPAAPVGYSLLALAGAISLGKLIYDLLETRKFKKELGFKQITPEEVHGTDEKVRSVEMQTMRGSVVDELYDDDDDDDDDDEYVEFTPTSQYYFDPSAIRIVTVDDEEEEIEDELPVEEGAFVQNVSVIVLTGDEEADDDDGIEPFPPLVSVHTWEYRPPCARDSAEPDIFRHYSGCAVVTS